MSLRTNLRTGFRVAATSVGLCVLLLASSLSLQAVRTHQDFRESIDSVGLNHARESFHQLDLAVRDIAAKVMNSRATVVLAQAPSLESVTPQFYAALVRIQDLQLPFVHSINVIHTKSGNVITTNRGWHSVEEDFLREIEAAHPRLPSLAPLPIRSELSGTGRDELVFAYIARERFEDDARLEQGAVVLIHGSWFVDGIARSNDQRTMTTFHLYHPSVGIMTHELDPLTKHIQQELGTRIAGTDFGNGPGRSTAGEFVVDFEGASYGTRMVALGPVGLRLLRIRDESLLRREVTLIWLQSIGLSALVVATLIAVGIAIHRRVYAPYYSVVADIRESIGDRIPLPPTDLELLSSVYSTLRDEFSGGGEDRVISDCLRGLTFTDDAKRIESEEVLRNRSVVVSETEPASLLMVSVDRIDADGADGEGANIQSQYASVMFQVRHALDAALAELDIRYHVSAIQRGRLLVLCFASGQPVRPRLHARLNEVPGESVSIVESRELVSIGQVGRCYERLVSVLRRRFLLGGGICLEESDVGASPTDSDRRALGELRQRVVHGIEHRQPDPEALSLYFERLRVWTVDAALDEVYLCLVGVLRALPETSRFRESQSMVRALARGCSIHEFAQLLEDLQQTGYTSERDKDSRHAAIALAAREIVDTRYSDPGLAMSAVAEELGVSTTYFSAVFRRVMGSSFADYLTMTRIQEAARLLNETRMPVLDIMAAVGIPSESTFYRRFREYYGITPQNYRIDMATRGVRERLR